MRPRSILICLMAVLGPGANALAQTPTRPHCWHGSFEVARDDPRLTSRGARHVLDITARGGPEPGRLEVRWSAGRGICTDPFSAPCEWVGASGSATGRVIGGRLVALLAVSADSEDPFVLAMDAPARCGRPAAGTLSNARGDFGFPVSVVPTPSASR